MLADALMALLTTGICTLCLSLAVSGLASVSSISFPVQNGLGILQLRQRAAISQTAACDAGVLSITRNYQEYEWKYDKGRIVQTPGYEIILEGLQEGRFVCGKDEIWLETDQGSFQIW